MTWKSWKSGFGVLEVLARRPNLWLMVTADILFICLAHYLAYVIRFDGIFLGKETPRLLRGVILAVPAKLAALYFFDLYRGMWRYMGLHDLINLFKANLTGSVLFALMLLGLYHFQGYSRGVFVIDFGLTFAFLGGYRIAIRMYFTEVNEKLTAKARDTTFPPKRVLIIGAGSMGEKLVREIQENAELPYQIAGLIDDDPQKLGRKIHGVPVLGSLSRLSDIAHRAQVEEIVIAISTVSAKGMRGIVKACEETGIPFRTVPGLWEVLEGRVSVSSVRPVRYEDLLGRQPVQLEIRSIGKYITGCRVLVTGGSGSIGSELCRQIGGFHPKKLIVLDKNESGLYDMDLLLKSRFPGIDIQPVLGPVQNRELMERLFEEHAPEVVFHAAAYKHVPMMELHPWEAVFNNIQGTLNLIQACHRHKAERFVLVSTDKAVRPANVMGASKRVAELITQSYARKSSTRFMAVRFGNVVGSAGSVVPLFTSQIERGGPVTVTHPEVTRYFMTIPEACSLILQAGALGMGGEIFVLKMGTPIRILDMAKDVISLHGLTPGKDIEIKFIGLRPGEKLYEELIAEGEECTPTSHQDIMVLSTGTAGDIQLLEKNLEDLKALAKQGDGRGIRRLLKRMIPEYAPETAGGKIAQAS
ncbi:MAG: polysaccharide biosynthesis protein [Deltaproteobacteria bacterium]|nr:polysaccharide biosynthesis protein [Deltaproteobacteria bacterium]